MWININHKLLLLGFVWDLTSTKTLWRYSKEMLRNLNFTTLTSSSVTFALLDPCTTRSLTQLSWILHSAQNITKVNRYKIIHSDVFRRVEKKIIHLGIKLWLYYAVKPWDLYLKQVIVMLNNVSVWTSRYWHAVPKDSAIHGQNGGVFSSQDFHTRGTWPRHFTISQFYLGSDLLLNCISLQHIQKKAKDWKVNMEVIAGKISVPAFHTSM